MDQLFIGTSGWNYKHWANGVFYPPGLKASSWLAYYCRFYNTVEVNNTFYGLPKRETFENWREITPRGFRFVLKVSRFFTHMKRLMEPQEHVAQFLEAASGLGEKLSVLLVQLPKGWGFNAERLEAALRFVHTQNLAPGVRFALEIRDPSWYTEECFELLAHFNAALVLADWPGFTAEGPVTGGWIYLRRHGPQALYSSNYSEELLQKDAANIRRWLDEGREVYAYFNNDVGGYAPQNSRRLKEILGEKIGEDIQPGLFPQR